MKKRGISEGLRIHQAPGSFQQQFAAPGRLLRGTRQGSAPHSLLHAKHAGSLQDPAAFCTALLQRGWGGGSRLPAQQQADGGRWKTAGQSPPSLDAFLRVRFPPRPSQLTHSVCPARAAAGPGAAGAKLTHPTGDVQPQPRAAACPVGLSVFISAPQWMELSWGGVCGCWFLVRPPKAIAGDAG